ncbi:helix-turn-helix domain-containing protein [Streptomyces sp. C8S0]|uniref:helix-turn-helix domain-containing protein n=1 Tax=Streptomyces sp. C8S0 TaxID=2585716 RepID=UPI00125D8121|nr:sigma factor-like helix-turn-helix DNA-binding protein [Streptomyces sp. C8S0]
MEEEEEVQRVLEAIDAIAAGEPPAVRALRLAEMMTSVQERFRERRQQAVREMHDSGMTYRQIAKELNISFGRVRQILAE